MGKNQAGARVGWTGQQGGNLLPARQSNVQVNGLLSHFLHDGSAALRGGWIGALTDKPF